MKKQIKNWEPMIFRPSLPPKWECLEQLGGSRSESTGYVRWGKDHHHAESRRFWVVFTEFNPYHRENENLSYRYTVRGGNDIKPEAKLRYFKNLRDAENYMFFLMESTDRWIAEINSQSYAESYDKRIAKLTKEEQ